MVETLTVKSICDSYTPFEPTPDNYSKMPVSTMQLTRTEALQLSEQLKRNIGTEDSPDRMQDSTFSRVVQDFQKFALRRGSFMGCPIVWQSYDPPEKQDIVKLAQNIGVVVKNMSSNTISCDEKNKCSEEVIKIYMSGWGSFSASTDKVQI